MKNTIYKILIFTYTLLACHLVFATNPTLENEIEKIEVRVKLSELYASSESVREQVTRLQENGYTTDYLANKSSMLDYWKSIDQKNTAEFKKILTKWGWPGISNFDIETDNKAFMIVQHSDYDLDFQKNVLVILERELKNHNTALRNYVYLWDRIKMHQNLPQRYATQGVCTGRHQWVPNKTEDLAHIDKIRKSVGLESLAKYKKVVAQYCP